MKRPSPNSSTRHHLPIDYLLPIRKFLEPFKNPNGGDSVKPYLGTEMESYLRLMGVSSTSVINPVSNTQPFNVYCPNVLQNQRGVGSFSRSETLPTQPEGESLRRAAWKRSFADILAGELDKRSNKLESTSPTFVGDSLLIEIEEDEYKCGVDVFKHSLIGRLVLNKGDKPYETKDLKLKLEKIWRTDGTSWKLIPLGRGFYNLLLSSQEDRARVLAKGALYLTPGVLRISLWTPDFNPFRQKQSNFQVWVRIYKLPLEYWTHSVLGKIGRGIGIPLKLDQKTFDKERGLFARMQIDVDFSQDPPEKILVRRKIEGRVHEITVFIEYEDSPEFCFKCGILGHSFDSCRYNTDARHRAEKDNGNDKGRQKRGGVYRRKEGENEKQNEEGRRQNVDGEENIPAENGRIPNEQLGEGSNTSQHGVREEEAREPVVAPQQQINGGIQAGSQQNNHSIEASRDFNGRTQRTGEAAAGAVQSEMIETQEAGQKMPHNTPFVHVSKKNCIDQARSSSTGSKVGSKQIQSMVQASASKTVSRTRVSTPIVAGKGYGKLGFTASQRIHNLSDIQIESQYSMAREANQNHENCSLLMNETVELDGIGSFLEEDEDVTYTSWSDMVDRDELGSEDGEHIEVRYQASTEKIYDNIQELDVSNLDADKVYWHKDEEIFIHRSGMCYDPIIKAYFSYVNPGKNDWRTIYYVKSHGEFKLAQKGDLGESNINVMRDKSFNMSCIYTSRSPNYKPGLQKLFMDVIKWYNKIER